MTPPEGEQQSLDASVAPNRRVGLRVVIGVLLVAGMVYGWAAMGHQKSLRQQEAITAVVAGGGKVFLDYEWQDGTILGDGQPQQVQWIRRLFGPENLDRAVAVDIRRVPDPARLVSCLRLMPFLKDLNASHAAVSDTDLKSIGNMVGLEYLDLCGTAITDEGAESLNRLSHLKELSLASTAVSDRCIDSLSGLRRLQHLDLTDTRLSPAAVVQLRAKLVRCQIEN